ncbi:MAG: CDP-archaeol synthase [Thermodesulfobacteriota bacterium]
MIVVFKIVALILWANFLPPLAKVIWGERFKRPLDGNRLWFDDQPVFGEHKTIRGILLSILGSMVASPLLGISWWVGGLAALLAMVGDLLSSFIKRRFKKPSGSNIVVLDQFFESLFPAFFLGSHFGVGWLEIMLILLCFIPVAYLGSCFWKFIIHRPIPENYPRTIRSTVRLREWRACHPPIAHWHTLFNMSSFLSYDIFLGPFFKIIGLYDSGLHNSLEVEIVEKTFSFPDLPEGFDGFRILMLSDLHLDGLKGLTEKLRSQLGTLEVDLCLIGGDIRMKTYGPMAPCLRELRALLPHVQSRHGVLGVLGNHDCIEMTPDFEETGVIMLINDSWEIKQNGSSLWIIGVDDPHYYRCHNVPMAYREVPDDGFSIFLAHSPESYEEAADFRARLYLCGHTHGGQICLPGRGPLFTNSRAPRFTASGSWGYQGMAGYTSRGAGPSGVPLRFNCPGEISLLTLCRETE